jgi:serine/threonine-protein kinase RsbW
MVLAVDEVCSNLIIHSHKCNAGDAIELSIRNQATGVTFEIIDRAGTYFDLNNYKAPELRELIDRSHKGGMGLRLVKTLMDKVEVEYNDSQSTWRLYKDIHRATV